MRWSLVFGTVAALSILTAVGCFVVGIAISSHALGGEGGIALGVAVLTSVASGFMADEEKAAGPRLSRADRRTLRAEESRIALQRRIADLEKQAGLR